MNNLGSAIRRQYPVIIAAGALLIMVSGCGRTTYDGEPITFDSMLPALTNRTAIAMPPTHPGRMRMFSSYDRTGGNIDWLTGLQPDAQGLVTLAEIEGPGCMVRLWVTGGGYRDLRFYIDGEREPRLHRPRDGFFGGDPPFSYPLSGRVSGGRYTYVPIPFAESLVIKAEWPDYRSDARPYIQINYFEFPENMPVESYPHELTPAQLNAVAAINRKWQPQSHTISDNPEVRGIGPLNASADLRPRRGNPLDPTNHEAALMDALDDAHPVVLAPGETHLWLDESGEGMIEGFAMTLDFDDDADPVARTRALRELALHLHWDGQTEPSVATPLGDFFGNALAWRSWRSMFASQVDGVFVSQWPMPYQQGAVGSLRNDGQTPVRVRTAHRTASRPDGARYFHAHWHHATGQGIPFPMLHTEGAGHYVGCYLISLGADGTWNILEGDESFRVDDEPWPSWHGTGLEDYFNGAWYYSGIFDLPIHGLLEKAAMRTTQYRWHPTDPVPFSERLSMQIQFGDGNTAQGYMASVTFWYQDQPRAGSMLAEASRRKPSDRLEAMVFMPEVIELERLGLWEEAAERSALQAARLNDPNIAILMNLRAAGYATLAGHAQAVNQYLVTDGMPDHPELIQQAGMLAALETNDDFALLGIQCRGSFRVYLNGEPIGDGNTPNRLAAWPVELPDGEHELTVEVTPDLPTPFLSLALRWRNTFLRTDAGWQMTTQQPADWPQTTDPDVRWMSAERGIGMLPRMDNWQIEPNAFVNMQSARQLLLARDIWDASPEQTVYFRRTFVK